MHWLSLRKREWQYRKLSAGAANAGVAPTVNTTQRGFLEILRLKARFQLQKRPENHSESTTILIESAIRDLILHVYPFNGPCAYPRWSGRLVLDRRLRSAVQYTSYLPATCYANLEGQSQSKIVFALKWGI